MLIFDLKNTFTRFLCGVLMDFHQLMYLTITSSRKPSRMLALIHSARVSWVMLCHSKML